MKKFLQATLAISILFSCQPMLAQQAFHTVKSLNVKDVKNYKPTERVVYDTLLPSSLDSLYLGLCGDSVKIYELNNPGFGYIGGNNSNGDLEIMQKFGVIGTGGVYSIIAMFGKKSNTSNAWISAKLYSVDPITHGPDTFIQITDPKTLNDIDTNSLSGLYTAFDYPGQIFVADSFFAVIELPTLAGDTIAVYATPQNCYSGKQQAYVKKSNGTFASLGQAGSYGLDADFWIGAVFIHDSIFVNSAITFRDLELYRAYPNPASNSINVNFVNKISTQVRMEFIDELGRIVQSTDFGMQQSGRHSINVDVSNLPAANYYYSIITTNERLFSRVAVVHH